MGRRKRQDTAPSSLTDHFVMHSLELRRSPPWRALPDNGRRLLMCLEEEHMRLGGSRNGQLGITYGQLADSADVRQASISLALRQCVALKFVEITRTGYKSVGGDKFPSLYRLTHVWGASVERGRKKAIPPTDEWRQIETADQAAAALASAVEPPSRRPRKSSAALRSVA